MRRYRRDVIQPENKVSSWSLRHDGELFKGQYHPFGCLIDFKPSPVRGKNATAKFAPKSVPGVFLGWFILPGGIFHGDYLVVALDEFREIDGKPPAVTIQRVKEIYRDPVAPITFPLKKHHDKRRRELPDIDTIVDGPEPAPEDVPPPKMVEEGEDSGDDVVPDTCQLKVRQGRQRHHLRQL